MSQVRVSKLIVPGALLAMLCGCQPSAPPPPAAAAPAWPEVRDAFVEGYFKEDPFFAARSGRHEFDGQVADMSAAGIQHRVDYLHASRTRIEAVDGGGLPAEQRFERDYLLRVIAAELFYVEKLREPFTNPHWYIDALDPDVYLSRNYAPLETRMKAYIEYARAVPRVAADAKTNLKGPMPKSFVELAVDGFGGYADFFKSDVAGAFKDIKDPELQKQLASADAAAAAAMAGLKDYFVAQRATATEQFALGKDLFAAMLADTEGVTVPIEDIEAAGRADLERNTAALQAECERYLPKATLKACLAKVSADKPKGGALEAARADLVLLKDFIVKNGVVTIPGTEDALVAEAPPYNRSNIAFIQVPGPFDQGVASVYNIAPPNPTWSKAEQAAYVPGKALLMSISAHEVWPGHFLQFLYSNHTPSKVEGLWVGYAFAEGWAHYTEEMILEMGFAAGDPVMHIGQLQNALWRDVRLLSAIGLHTHGMTEAESEKMFLERAFLDPGNCRQQAARGTYDPGYLNYTLGKLMIRKLRTDWIAKKLAGRTASPAEERVLWHDFHDAFLSHGGPAIPRLRLEMLGEAGTLL